MLETRIDFTCFSAPAQFCSICAKQTYTEFLLAENPGGAWLAIPPVLKFKSDCDLICDVEGKKLNNVFSNFFYRAKNREIATEAGHEKKRF